MNTQKRSKSIQKMIGLLFILFPVLVLSSCSHAGQADKTACLVDMEMRVTMDVTDKPQAFFDQLADQAGCSITVSPFVWKHVTLHVKNATVAEVLAKVCSQIGCIYILNGNHLAIKPYTMIDRMKAKQGEEFNREMEQRNRILQSRLPEGMRFEDAQMSAVLEEISKASGLEIKPWKDEGDRKVTVDVSGMTVNDALKAVVRYVNGEGAVLIKLTYRFPPAYGQHWLWGYPPNP